MFELLVTALDVPDPTPTLAMEWAVGAWELDPSETEDREKFTCDQHPLVVSIDKNTTGTGYIYTSEQNGQRDVAPISLAVGTYLRFTYDGEERLDPDGNPLEWIMFFPNKDQFYWLRVDAVEDGNFGRTAMRRRCAEVGV